MKTINTIIKECDNYNKKNGTLLSYGKYVALQYINRGKKNLPSTKSKHK